MRNRVTIACVYKHLNEGENVEKYSMEDAAIIYHFLRKLADIQVEITKEDKKQL